MGAVLGAGLLLLAVIILIPGILCLIIYLFNKNEHARKIALSLLLQAGILLLLGGTLCTISGPLSMH